MSAPYGPIAPEPTPPTRPPRRRRIVGAGLAAVVVAAGAGVGWWALGDGPDSADPVAATPALDAAAAADAPEVAAALRRLAEDPSALLSGTTKGVNLTDAIPDGTTVEPHEKSWAPDGFGGGVMAVTLTAPDQEPTTFAAVMARESGHWKVLMTVPAESAADSDASPAPQQ